MNTDRTLYRIIQKFSDFEFGTYYKQTNLFFSSPDKAISFINEQANSKDYDFIEE